MPDQVSITVVTDAVQIAAGQVTSITAGTGLTGGTITSSGTIAADFASDGSATAGKVVQATDSRLSNSRFPTTHGSTHGPGGSDPIPVAGIDQAQVANLTSDLSAKVGTSTQVVAGTGLTGGGSLTGNVTVSCDFAADGIATIGKPVQATDSRLSNARTPTTHASTHGSAGSDPITIAQSQVTDLSTDLAAKVPTTRTITAGTGLSGGGDLSANRTLSVSFGTSSSTACVGNDSRLSNARTPTVHATTHGSSGSDPVYIEQNQVEDLITDLAAKAPTSRAINSGTGLTGGGDLSADRTLAVSFGTSGTTACVGNDSRLSNARTPTTHASTHTAGGSDEIAVAQSQVTGLTTALSGKASTSTTITAGTGLTGGGDLSANRTLTVAYGTTSGTACQGNDSRLSDSRAPNGSASGDLGGTYPGPTVAKLQGVSVESTAPSNGDILRYVSSTTSWTPSAGEDVQLFTTSSTWTKPSGCRLVKIICIGAGGGGGSGHASASGTRGGGGGGGGGGISEVSYRSSDLPASLTVTVGTGGGGGAGAISTNDGQDGTAGGASSVSASGTTYNYAGGGNYGGKGTNAGGTAGAALNDGTSLWWGGAGGNGGAGAVGVAASNSQGAPGGGGGGGISSGAVYYNGGNGAARIGIGSGGSGTTGGSGSSVGFYGTGGGGSPASAGTSGNGGNGGYGAGGGGSGAGAAASGAGGSGGNGLVCIISSW